MTKTQIAKWILERMQLSHLEKYIACTLCAYKENGVCGHKCVEGIAESLRNAEKERYGKQEKVTKSCEYCKNSYHEYGTIFCREHSVQCDGNYIMDISNTKIAEKCKNFEHTNKSCFER